jgi:NAD(P)-dependent dehydrogenase (short-subunit alcohol dehydrogenase family)
MEFTNKTVVITGGSRGIGAACSKRFLEDGANVAILDIDAPGNELKSDRLFFQYCDVTKEKEVENCINKINEAFSRIDILINNAGIQRYGSVTETTVELWDEVMNCNLKSMFLCSHFVLPFIQKQERGVVINVSSVQAFHSQKNVAAYATSKTAILGLTRSIAVDYAPSIRCISVCPGTVDTPMLRNAIAESADPAAILKECEEMHLVQRIGSPTEIAELIKYLCSNNAAFITGTEIKIDGGLGITINGSKK